jgi:hypothetical protein
VSPPDIEDAAHGLQNIKYEEGELLHIKHHVKVSGESIEQWQTM